MEHIQSALTSLRIEKLTLMGSFLIISNICTAISQKDGSIQCWVSVLRGIKHEWEPNLHLVPIPLVSYRSR